MRKHLMWAVALIGSAVYAQTNPVPLVNNPLVPDSATPGSAGFTLTVNGTGFVSTSVVNWNATPRATAFVSHSRVTATILASDIAAAGTGSITVTNPAPGGGTSNVVFFQIATPATTVAMATASTYPVASAEELIAGDVNGDGKLDLIATNGNSPGTVTVMLGNGDGTFQAPATFATGLYPQTATMADFNNDGKLDLAVADDDGIDVLLGNGDGTFQPYKASCCFGSSIAVGDFNEDGKLDLAVVNGTTVVLLGNGDGTFQAGTPLNPGNMYAVLTGDFNRDGHLDLAVAGATGINIFLGNGDGTFQPPISRAGDYYRVATADFNGDGILDLAAIELNGTSVTILLGKGNGTFGPAINYSAGRQSTFGLVTGDFNGDGRIDLAVTELEYNLGGAAILLGNDDGTFQPAVSVAGQYSAFPWIAGDFNGDGRLDLAAIQYPPGGSALVSVNLQTSAALAPGLLSFAPTLNKTTSAPTTMTLTNYGAVALGVSQVALSGTNAGSFALATDTCQGAVIQPSGNCTVGVTFSPVATGEQSALLTITDNASVPQQTTALTANGTAVSLVPARLDFGRVKVGTASPQKIIRATNTGTSTIDIKAIITVGRNAKDFVQSNSCGNSLKPKASCSILIQFVPLQKGVRSGYVSFSLKTGPQFDPKLIALSGIGD